MFNPFTSNRHAMAASQTALDIAARHNEPQPYETFNAIFGPAEAKSLDIEKGRELARVLVGDNSVSYSDINRETAAGVIANLARARSTLYPLGKHSIDIQPPVLQEFLSRLGLVLQGVFEILFRTVPDRIENFVTSLAKEAIQLPRND